MSSDQSVNAETIEQTKQQIRGLVSEIAQLSKSGMSPEEFHAAFLQRVIQALAAVGGAIWTLGEGRRPQLAYQINLSETLLQPESEEAIRHLRLLNHVIGNSEPQLIPPLSGTSEEDGMGNPTRYLLVLAPLQADGQVEGVVEIFQRADSPPATQRGYLRFLIQMAELAADWLKSRKLQHFSDRHSLWAQADHFARLVHDSLDPRETAYTAVNEARRIIGCDRVGIAIKRGSRCKIEAISGQDTLENRSNIIATLNDLATKVVATGESLWYEGQTDDLPPQVERAIDEYVEESYGKSVIVLPLRKPKTADDLAEASATGDEAAYDSNLDAEVIGAMIIEQLETELPYEVIHPRIDLVYEHTARAMANSLEHNNLFLMPVWRTLGKAAWLVRARTLPKTLAVVIGILAVVLFLALFPARFNMRATGTLEPVVQADVFVSVEGIVDQVLVKDQQPVKEGEPLLVLRNTDLTTQKVDLLGRRTQTDKQHSAAERLLLERGGTLGEEERNRLAGQVAELDARLKSLDRQLVLIDEKIKQLTIRAPMDGEVLIAWDVEKSLMQRPVTIGQVVMTVADTAGQWELELFMPERRMHHVDAARKRLGEDEQLEVSYILKSNPGTYRYGKVYEVNNATQVHPEEGATVRMRVNEITTEGLNDPRPGTNCIARLRCGWRPIGYVWFHEAWEWAQVNLLF